MSTPLISPIKNVGGTFYTFPSASEDFNFSQNSSNKKFKFSKFVLLDIPDVKDASTGINTLGLDHIPSSYIKVDTSDWNTVFAESLQNYAFNLETLLVSQGFYDATKNSTVSERVFWKWLKEMGAIRWREANVGNPEAGGERTRRTEDSLNVNDLSKRQEIGKRFVEEDARTTTSGDLYPYDPLVKYIGSIDIVNGVKYQGSSFLELYIMVPTDVGSTPTVLFKSKVNDSNYPAGALLTHNPEDPLNKEYLVGRSFNDSHPSGIDLRSHYDSDNDVFVKGTSGVDYYSLSIKKNGEDSFTDGWWFPDAAANSYYTEPNQLNDYRNDWMKITGWRDSVSNDKDFLRSRLDGVEIDFDLARSYSDNLTGEYRTFEDYNRSSSSEDFSFNTILIYYDLEDLDDPSKNATNLFGVLFLDRLRDSLTSSATMTGLTKYKPKSTARQNGNAYAWKVNLKFDLNANDGVEITSVNEYNNFSMHLFLDALESLRNANDKITTTLADISNIQTKVDSLEDLIVTSDNVTDITNRIDQLEESIQASTEILQDSDSLLKLLERNYDEVLNIYKNFTSVEMSYNIDVIRSGRGIEVDRSQTGVVRINKLGSSYTLSKPTLTFSELLVNGSGNYLYHNHALSEGSNYLKLFGSDSTLRTDTVTLQGGQRLIIFVDDTSVKWVKGQSVKIVLEHEYQFLETLDKAISVYTDATNKKGSSDGPYSVEMGYLSGLDVKNSSYRPVLELTCLDPEALSFTLDILR